MSKIGIDLALSITWTHHSGASPSATVTHAIKFKEKSK